MLKLSFFVDIFCALGARIIVFFSTKKLKEKFQFQVPPWSPQQGNRIGNIQKLITITKFTYIPILTMKMNI